ncbi:Ig-like domain repeat protein [Gemmata sp. JC717]|uniref:Ig-like domain repeat protein n=1 Tax=Gemmata algarum TaxID=2975278 RepID=UPI0021BB9699|nr:Ig-like domain repeat protein [Gemmata algarum]MDY3556234.1 Ig-like domain repeat protein [Gemmata algarum]
MPKSWLRQLFRQKSGRRAAPLLTFEILEARVVPANVVWTGNAVPPPPAPGAKDTTWGNPNNWDIGVPQAGDTVIFPAGLDAAHKPPAAFVNNAFVFPDPANYAQGSNSTLDANYDINDLIIQDDNYHIDALAGSNFTLTIRGRIITNFSQTLGSLTGLSLLGPLSGPSRLTIQLTAANTGGTSFLQADGTGILYINANITQTANVNSIEKIGTGPIALAGVNTFSAGVAVTSGTLIASSDTALGDTSRGTTVANGATLAITNGASVNESLTITGTGVGGAGALRQMADPYRIFRNANPTNPACFWTGGITLSPSAAIGASGRLTISGTGISGSGDLSKVGGGTVSLSVANTYAGQTLVQQGTLEVTDNLALSPVGPNVSPNGTTPGTSAGSSTTVSAGATLELLGNLTINETLFLNGDGLLDNVGRGIGALHVTGTTTYTGTVTLLSNASIGTFTSSFLRLNGLMYGAFDLSKVDEGNVRIASANPSFSGNTFVRNGTLELADQKALGLGGKTITVTATTGIAAAQGTLQLEGTYALVHKLALNGAGFQNTGAVHTVAPANPGTTTITMPLGTTLVGPASLSIDSATRFDVTGVVSGPLAASLTKTGTGTFSLQANNTYLGTTTFRAGLNIITASGALGGAGGGDTTVFAGATLQLDNSLAVTGENLNIAGRGTANQGALVATGGVSTWGGLVNLLGIQSTRADFSVLAGSLEFANVVSGDADLHKLGAGELRFTGSAANTYSTATYVERGTLSLGKRPPAGAVAPLNAVGGQVFVGTAPGTGNNSAVLRLLAPNQIPELVSGISITLSIAETGLFDLNGFAETVGPLILNGGEVTTGAGVLTLTTDVDARLSTEVASITGNVSLGGATRTFSSRSSPGVSFSASANPAQFGSPVTFTVTLNVGAGAPATGSVDFFDGTTLLGTAFVNGLGVATFTTSNLAAGARDITAVYSGNNNYSPVTIALPSTLQVVGAPSRQLLSSTANQAAPGDAGFQFSVTRTSTANPVPTGTVTIKANGVAVGFGFLDATGAATVSAFGLTTPGSYVITAEYSGDAYYAPSIVTLSGNQIIVDAPSMVVTSSANGSATNQAVTFRFQARASGTSPTPTGMVAFFDGATQIGATKTLDANGLAVADPITTLTAGNHVITAQYFGDALYEPQTVVLLGGQQVTTLSGASALLLSTNASPAAVGQQVTFTFQVNNAAASGSVSFRNNGIPLGGAVPVVNGVAQFTTTFSTAGAKNITAVYTGGGGSNGGTATLAPVQVVASPLNVQLSSNFNPALTGVTQTVGLVFTAEPQANNPNPGGTVSFFNGTTLLGTAPLAFSFATGRFQAQVGVTGLTFGQQFITAVYTGDANYAGTTVELNPQEAITSPPTIRFTSSASTVLTNQNVTFNFSATPTAGNPNPGGTVTFFADGVQIGTTQNLSNGSASITQSFATVGARVITARYSGDVFYEAETVTLAPDLSVVTTLPTPPATTIPAVATVFAVSGNVFGSAGDGIIKDGSGVVTIDGSNSYSGTTQIVNGTLRLVGDNTLPDTTQVTLTNTFAVFDVNGRTDVIASLAGSGSLAFGTGGSLTTGGNNASTTLSGPISGSGTLNKIGTGTLTLAGASAGYTGTTVVTGGTVFLASSYGNANVTVQPGATLAGSGIAKAVTVAAGGRVSPGGTSANPNTVGTLTGTGNLTLSPGAVFAVNVDGPNAGAPTNGYDQYLVNSGGSVNLNGATLQFNLGYAPALNTSFTLISVSGGGTVTGTFANLPTSGSTFVLNDRVYAITYGATSVSVQLVALASTASLTSSPNPSLPGESVTFTATITPNASGDPVPVGNIQFYVNGVASGAPVPVTQVGSTNAAAATFTTTLLPSGPNLVTATFTPAGGSAYPAFALGNTAMQVTQLVTVPSTLTVTAQQGPITFGGTASFLAAVAQTGGQAPTGTFTFANAATGAVLGVVALDGTGRAVFSTAALPAGTATVAVTYSGDSFYRASTATVTQVVDRQNRVVVGSDAGPVATVQVFDPRTGALVGTFQPFDQYTGGVKVATGDVNNDGVADIVVSAGAGAPGGHVKVYDGVSFGLLSSFFTFPGYNGGVNVAVGDVNGDGFGDVVIGTAVGNDHVKAFSGRSLLNGGIAGDGTADPSTILSFFAYGGGNPVGVTVAAGDVDGDGRADVITGSATFAGHVKAFSASGQQIGSYFAYGAGYLGGIYVAAGDLNGDGRAEIVTGATNAPHVKALRLDGTEVASFFAYTNGDGSPAPFGVRVAVADRNGDRLADILTGSAGGAPHVKAFSGLDPSLLLDSFLAIPPGQAPSTSGVFVGGSAPK